MLKFRARFYKENGDVKSEYYTDDFREVLEMYVAKGSPSTWNFSKIRPTLWVLFDGAYTRVHDFNFEELTDETYEKYLAERIIWSDYLLEELQ